MPELQGFSIPSGFRAGALLQLASTVRRDRIQDFSDGRVSVKAGRRFLQVAISRISGHATLDALMAAALPLAETFLDIMAVEERQAHRIIHPSDNILWRLTGTALKVYLNASVTIAPYFPALTITVTRPDGTVEPPPPYNPPNAQAAFRYYRFSQSSDNLFEAYRYMFLCLESVLDDVFPRKALPETEWLKAALCETVTRYSVDLSGFAVGDPVEGFIEQHYNAIRCATFHAKKTKKGSLLPGNVRDSAQVRDQLLKLQPVVEAMLKKHFGARLPIAFLFPAAVRHVLESLAPHIVLVTSPESTASLSARVREALDQARPAEGTQSNSASPPAEPLQVHTATGDQPANVESRQPPEPDRPGQQHEPSKLLDEINGSERAETHPWEELIEKAQATFRFELLPVTYRGNHRGLIDEWLFTTDAPISRPEYSKVRSLALFGLTNNGFIEGPVAYRLRETTIATDLDLTGLAKVEYRIRVILRQQQGGPRRGFTSD